MVLAPILVGSILGGFAWQQLLLTVTALIGFQFYDVLSLWILSVAPRPRNRTATGKLRLERGKKYLPALLSYATLFVGSAVALILREPSLLWFGLALVPLVLASLQQTWTGSPRSFLARSSMITAACLLMPMATMLGTRVPDWRHIWIFAIVLAVYFIGTIAYVKTMIRERGNPTWLRFSLTYHAVLVALAAVGAALGVASPWLAAVFAVLLLRAWLFPYLSARRPHPIKPVVFGSTEFLFCGAVAAALLLG